MRDEALEYQFLAGLDFRIVTKVPGQIADADFADSPIDQDRFDHIVGFLPCVGIAECSPEQDRSSTYVHR